MELNGSHVGLTVRLTYRKKDKKRTEVVDVKFVEFVKHYLGGDVELGHPRYLKMKTNKHGWRYYPTRQYRYPYNAEVEFV